MKRLFKVTVDLQQSGYPCFIIFICNKIKIFVSLYAEIISKKTHFSLLMLKSVTSVNVKLFVSLNWTPFISWFVNVLVLLSEYDDVSKCLQLKKLDFLLWIVFFSYVLLLVIDDFVGNWFV